MSVKSEYLKLRYEALCLEKLHGIKVLLLRSHL